MGGSVSAGRNNDELIDHLVEAEFIRTPEIQQVFRAVDRGNYYNVEQRDSAYRDIAWRVGNLHLSAPCVYSEVMEALKLRPGLSFLNLGSGSGYLSTIAGLILGTYGTNHGVELYRDIVDFAYERLDEFVKKSGAMDEFEFCEPSFIVGNCLKLDSNCQQYDRVYCGASCPEEYEPYVKSLVKVGGILIMPLNEKLLKITRTSETTWKTSKVLSVSFTPLVAPSTEGESTIASEPVKLGNITPPQLKQICRSSIRSLLRNNIIKDNPKLAEMQRKVDLKGRRHIRRIVIPIFDESDLSNHSQSDSDLEYDSDSPEFTISSRIPSRMSALLEDFLRRHAELQELSEAANSLIHLESSDESDNDLEETDDTNNDQGSNTNSVSYSTYMSAGEDQEASGTTGDSEQRYFKITRSSTTRNNSEPGTSKENTSSTSKSTKGKGPKAGSSKASKAAANSRASKAGNSKASNAEGHRVRHNKGHKNRASSESRPVSPRMTRSAASAAALASLTSGSSVAANTRSHTNLGTRSSFIFKRKRPNSQAGETSHIKRRAATVVWKRYTPKDSDSEMQDESKSNEKEGEPEENYTTHMVRRISDLPLPISLLRYLNYRRDNM